MKLEKPDFLEGVFLWRYNGYQFMGKPPKDLLEPNALQDQDPWIRIAATLEHAKNGNFSVLPPVIEYMHTCRTAALWNAYSLLFAHTTSSTLLKKMLNDFYRELFVTNDFAMQRDVPFILRNSLFLWTVPILLDIYLKAIDHKEAMSIPLLCSTLVEKKTERIFYSLLPDEKFKRLVLEKYELLCTKLGTSEVPVLYGELFSVRKLAQHLHDSILAKEDNFSVASISVERAFFEASTGIDCRRFYVNAELQPLVATTIIEEFLESTDCKKYQDGVRYFFGHRIPD